jgi:hypothetical protein
MLLLSLLKHFESMRLLKFEESVTGTRKCTNFHSSANEFDLAF